MGSDQPNLLGEGLVLHDGQSWNLVEAPSNLLGADVITDGKRGLIAVNPTTDEAALPVIATVGDDLSVSTLSQAGDVLDRLSAHRNCAIGRAVS